jgi:hypothetical protein
LSQKRQFFRQNFWQNFIENQNIGPWFVTKKVEDLNKYLIFKK